MTKESREQCVARAIQEVRAEQGPLVINHPLVIAKRVLAAVDQLDGTMHTQESDTPFGKVCRRSDLEA